MGNREVSPLIAAEKPLLAEEGFIPSLPELGISHNLSSRAQAIASIPDADACGEREKPRRTPRAIEFPFVPGR
jgi:hypothetical protein